MTLASLPGPGGQISLREAICAANSNPGPDTITFSVNGTFALTGAVNDDNGNSGDFDIKQSLTINGNGAASTILNGGGAAFVSVSGGAVTLTNVTISNNTADNDNNGSGAGGGFSQGSTTTVTMRNTLVAGNFNSTAATRDDISGAAVAASSFNLIGDGTGMSGISNGVNNYQVGSGASPINPLLGPLVNNGGPTETHALLTGSPAIDTGGNAVAPPTDQRGIVLLPRMATPIPFRFLILALMNFSRIRSRPTRRSPATRPILATALRQRSPSPALIMSRQRAA